MNKINQLINEYVDDFIKIISNEYNIDYCDIKNKWIKFTDLDKEKPIQKPIQKPIEKVKQKPIEKPVERVKEKPIEKVKEKINKTTIEEKYKEKIKYKINSNNDSDSESNNESEDEFVVRKKPKQFYSGSGILIRLNKMIKKYVHRDSGMVFYSKDDLIVYAKLLDNKLCKLTSEDKEVCKKLKFRVDTSLYNDEDENYVYSDIKSESNVNDEDDIQY